MAKRHNITDIVKIDRCETQVQLDRRYGERVDAHTQKRRMEGVRFHEQMESGSDRRCYIATALFGPHAPETKILRRFRDDHLLYFPLGRGFCLFYYRWSPFFIRKAPTFIAPLFRGLLKIFCQYLDKP